MSFNYKEVRHRNCLSKKITLLAFMVLAGVVVHGQGRKFKSNEIVDVGGGVKVEVLVCKGDGADEKCDVIYYTGRRQTGKRFWQSANKLREEERLAAQRKTDSLLIAERQPNYNVDSAGREIRGKAPLLKANIKVKTSPATTLYNSKKNALTIWKKDTVAKTKSIIPLPPFDEENKNSNNLTPVLLPPDSLRSLPKVSADSILVYPNDSSLKMISRTGEKLSVFIDCNASCDFNYLRTELVAVDFLLDRLAADVHVLVSEQRTGGGGSSIQLIFYGQQQYKTLHDTLALGIDPNATAFERRAEMLRGIKIGLLPFIMKTSYAKLVDVHIKAPAKETGKTDAGKKDPWNYWVFRTGADASMDKDQVYNSLNVSGNFSINRTTDKLKVNFRSRGNYYNFKYNYQDNGVNITYEIKNRQYLVDHSLIKSLGEHWGIGYQAAFSNNTFINTKAMLYGKAAVEYSIFPYKDVNTRFFTISYGVDIRNNTYYDTTIYFKTRETLTGHSIQANVSFFQKWGSFGSSIAYRNFFNDPSLSNLSASLNWDVRITGGLSFYFSTYAAQVRDQVYLLKGKATEQDVLTKRRALASTYTFSSSAGLSFRFGSKLNNFVNARMGSL